MAPIDPQAAELFGAPNFVHVATLMPDGSPHSVAVWGRVEGGRLHFFTQETAQKARNLARDPRLAVSAIDRERPYRGARGRGRVVETLTGDAALEVIDRISLDYTGAEFPMRSGIVFVAELEHSAFLELPFQERR